MIRSRSHPRGFTLIELIMVMIIVAIVAAVIAPSLHNFGLGRKTNNAASQILGLAQYARSQAITQARVYRLNFDTSARTYWLTMDVDGVFQPPTNDYGEKYQAPDGVRLDVNVTIQFNSQMNLPSTIQQNQVLGNPLTDQPNLQPNYLMQNVRDPGQSYVEFLPTGRSDVADIKLTDSTGRTVELSCASPSETFRILKPGETR